VFCEYELAGIDRVRRLYQCYMSGFPDCHYDIKAIGVAEVLDNLYADDDSQNACVMVHWQFRGTNLGSLWDAPASGRHSKFSGVHVLKFDEDDLITHIETYRQPSEDERRQLSFDWN